MGFEGCFHDLKVWEVVVFMIFLFRGASKSDFFFFLILDMFSWFS